MGISLNASHEMPPLASHTKIDVPDLILCAAILAYVVAHCRLQGLLNWILPPDPRRRAIQPSRAFPRTLLVKFPSFFKQKRDARLVGRQEIGVVLLTLPVWTALAQVCWHAFPRDWGNPGVVPGVWLAVLIFWIGGGVLAGVAIAVNYWYRRQMSPEECLIYLQDALWQDTRREQRRIGRWLAWSALRCSERREKT